MFAGFIGVILIASFQNSSNIDFSHNLGLMTLGLILTFVVAWKQAALNVVNRKLKEVHFLIPIFYQALIVTPLIVLYLIV